MTGFMGHLEGSFDGVEGSEELPTTEAVEPGLPQPQVERVERSSSPTELAEQVLRGTRYAAEAANG